MSPSPVGFIETMQGPMTDAEREIYIRYCAAQMEAAMARYEADSCLSDRGEADGWRRSMEEAIRQRSPEQIARMEAEGGLS
jgi:hypothetical protein